MDSKRIKACHLGQRMAGAYSFGYGAGDRDGAATVARFIGEHMEHSEQLLVVLTDDVPDGYEWA